MILGIRWLSTLMWAAMAWLVLDCPPALASIIGGTGNDPVRDAGWPRGSVDVANLKTRIAWWEGPPFGGGEWHFEYRGSTAELQAAVDAFGKVLAPQLELVVRGGRGQSFWIKTSDPKADASVDWEFTVWVPANWNRLYNNPRSYFASDQPNFRQPVAAPRLDVYIGGQVDWSQVKIPANVTVIDRRLEANGIAADAGGAFLGRVWDMDTGKPIAGVRIRIGEGSIASGETDAEGGFAIERIPAGGHVVTVDAEGYAAKRVGFIGANASFFQQVDIILSAERELVGRVVGPDDQPLGDVNVRLANVVGLDGRGYPRPAGQTRVRTDAEGRFLFRELPSGIVQLACSKSGYYYNPVLNVHSIDDSPLALQMVRSGTVRVSVVDAEGKPIASNFIVELEPEGGSRVGSWSGSSNVSADGTVVFQDVPPGRYTVHGKPNPSRADATTKVHALTIVGADEHQIQLHWE